MHLEEIFISQAPSRVTGAAFLVTENGEADIGSFEYLSQRFG